MLPHWFLVNKEMNHGIINLYCLPYISYDVSLENLLLDQLHVLIL